MADFAANTALGIKQDRVPFLEYPSSHGGDLSRRHCLIYFIPGNPGLIDYYARFFTALRQLLDQREAKEGCRHAFHLYGRNLIGFEDEDHEPPFGTTTTTVTAAGLRTEPFSLEEQISCACEQVQQVTNSTLKNGRILDDVILIGHSVGAYIALEVFNRHHHARQQQQQQQQQEGKHTTPSAPEPPLLGNVNLKAGILLFPTISHIARSPSGRKLDLIRRVSLLDRSAHHIAKGFVSLWPQWLLGAIVRRVMGFPPHAVAATLRLLASRDGIWQGLHMGKDEMETITEEKWSEELWEIQEAEEEQQQRGGEGGEGEVALGGGMTKFFFYFAKRDHWVADECRDEFIRRRERHQKGRTRVVIDEAGIPHAFCIHHSEMVAEKVKVWIEDIAGL